MLFGQGRDRNRSDRIQPATKTLRITNSSVTWREVLYIVFPLRASDGIGHSLFGQSKITSKSMPLTWYFLILCALLLLRVCKDPLEENPLARHSHFF